MDPALKNGPTPCRDPDAFKSSAKVRYPYMGTDVAEIPVPSLRPTTPSVLGKSFDIDPATGTPVRGMLGFDSGPEKAYMQKLRGLVRDGVYFAKGPNAARMQIRELSKRAGEYLDLVVDYYTADSRSLGEPMSKVLDVGDATEWGPVNPGAMVGRNQLRLDIIEAYRNAAQVLWCTEYGMAEIEAYTLNREEHEDILSKPGPGGLVQPGNYTPVEYSDSDWNISVQDFGDLPEIDTEEPDLEDAPASNSGGAIAIVAGVAVVGLIYAFTRK